MIIDVTILNVGRKNKLYMVDDGGVRYVVLALKGRFSDVS